MSRFGSIHGSIQHSFAVHVLHEAQAVCASDRTRQVHLQRQRILQPLAPISHRFVGDARSSAQASSAKPVASKAVGSMHTLRTVEDSLGCRTVTDRRCQMVLTSTALLSPSPGRHRYPPAHPWQSSSQQQVEHSSSPLAGETRTSYLALRPRPRNTVVPMQQQ